MKLSLLAQPISSEIRIESKRCLRTRWNEFVTKKKITHKFLFLSNNVWCVVREEGETRTEWMWNRGKKEKLKHANIMLQRVKLNVKPLGEEAVSTTDVIFCFFSLSFLVFFFKLHLLDDDKFFSLTTSSCSFFLHIYRIK
jgi:hypothetical protein